MTDMSNQPQPIDMTTPHVDPSYYAMLPQCNDCKERVAYRGAHFDGLRWRCLGCWERVPKPDADFDFGA